MEVEEGEDYTGLVIYDKYGRVEPTNSLLIQKSGGGKTLASGRIAEDHHNKGWLIISLTDVKKKFENCFAMYEPQAKYHLDKLMYEGIIPSKKKIKIYHPFSFDIPKTSLPDMDIFTIPIKSLDRTKLSFIAESHFESDSVRLLNNALNDVPDNTNIYDLIWYIRKHSMTQKYRKYGTNLAEPDSKTFFLDTAQKGSKTNIQEIASWFKPFLKDYFLAPKGFKLNLDVKKILKDQEHYHCLTTKYIQDPKMEYFSILCFFDEIMRNIDYAEHPILFLIEEIASLCPYKSEGYMQYLAEYFRRNLLTMRSKGKGCACVMTSQVWWDISEDVREKTNVILFGNLGGVADLDRVRKSLGLKQDAGELLRTMKKNTFMMMGNEDLEGFRVLFPSHCHAEVGYNFMEMYKKFYPEKIKKYSDVIDFVKNHLKGIEKGYKEKGMEQQKKLEKEAEEDFIKRSGVDKAEKQVEEMKEKYKGLKENTREEKISKVKELKDSNPEMSLREIAKIVGVSYGTVKIYLDAANQKEKLPKVQEESNAIKYEDIPQ